MNNAAIEALLTKVQDNSPETACVFVSGNAMTQAMRINRFLSLAGVASRRKADDLVRTGRVRVNGQVLREVGTLVDPDTDRVTVDGRPVKKPEETLVWVFHKPVGYLVSRRTQGGRPTIYSILPPKIQPLQPVGRLDLDVSGVLVLTNDGELSRRLQHPKYQIERVYRATVAGIPDPARIAVIRAGVDLGDKTTAHADIRILHRREAECALEVRIREGRKREVKRLLVWAGAPVRKLARVSFAGIEVGNLPEGVCRALSKTEIRALRKLTGLEGCR